LLLVKNKIPGLACQWLIIGHQPSSTGGQLQEARDQ
jgi:hypothetical protein